MKLSGIVLAVVLAASVPHQPGEPTPPATSRDLGIPSFTHRATEPPSSPVLVGDVAPDFAWQDTGRRTVSMKDLLVQGSLLLVFSPGDEHLRAIEREREALLDLGVIPVGVMNARAGAASNHSRRLGLGYLLVPDSRRVIAAQYGAVDEVRQSTVPSWFVLDRRGQVRALGRGSIPRGGFPRLAATVLAIPTGDVLVPTRTR